jgi:hypothetical protein
MHRSLVISLSLLLVACGGGGHSSGSNQVIVGTYRGTANLTATAGSGSASGSGPIVLEVSPDHQVAVGRFPPVPLSGKNFATNVPASALNTSGFTCTQGTFGVDGEFSGTSVSGTITSANMRCNGAIVAIVGDYTATLQAETRRDGAEADLATTMQETLNRALRTP